MTATQAVLSPGRATRALAMLFLGAFVIGSSELLIVGVLNLIAGDLGVSVSAAGESPKCLSDGTGRNLFIMDKNPRLHL